MDAGVGVFAALYDHYRRDAVRLSSANIIPHFGPALNTPWRGSGDFEVRRVEYIWFGARITPDHGCQSLDCTAPVFRLALTAEKLTDSGVIPRAAVRSLWRWA